MDLREFLNNILAFIGSESLTDDEFGSVGDIELEYDKYSYGALDSVLEARESVSDARDRLRNYYLARGVVLDAVEVAKSNIFIGVGL